eukprot:s111_g22.t1
MMSSRVMQKVCARVFGIIRSPKIFVVKGWTTCYKRVLLWLREPHVLGPRQTTQFQDWVLHIVLYITVLYIPASTSRILGAANW